MTTFSTHVLDSGRGVPASGIALTLTGPDGTVLVEAATDADGRLRPEVDLGPGDHVLALATGPWFDLAAREHLHPSVSVAFTVSDAPHDPEPHLHVAVLLGPWSYTTYRGS